MRIVLGITGGIATGKSTVMAMFRDLGAQTLSADDVAHDVLSRGSEAAAEVARLWPDVALADGSIDRTALGDIVFADGRSRERLNAITHPLITAVVEKRIRDFREARGGAAVLAAEIPLLIECSLREMVDRVVVVAAEQETQLSRLTNRGLDAGEASHRIASQMPVAEKLAFADWVVSTDCTLAETRRRVADIWQEVVAIAAG